MNPLSGSHTPVQSQLNDTIAQSVISSSERVACEAKIYQPSSIDKGSKGTIRGAGIRAATKFLQLIKNMIKVSL